MYLKHIEMCYALKLYDKCIKFCQSLSDFNVSSEEANTVRLYEAKALFHMYSSQLIVTQASKLREWSPECLETIRKVIRLLTVVRRNGCFDEEYSYILDVALMDHLPATRSRSDVEVCLLCLKRGKLEKSHVIPAAIFRDFVSGVSRPTSNKVIFTNFLSEEWKYAAPGQMAVYMLCKECEGTLSKIENDFLTKFFRQIYDASNPARTQQQQHIMYGTWLYQFAASLMFRGIAKCFSSDRIEISNHAQVYNAWNKCRRILQASELGSSELKEQAMPVIFLIILPTQMYPGFENLDFVRWCKEDLEIKTIVASSSGSQQLGNTAVYFIVKLGVFLFFMSFDDVVTAVMPDSTRIHPKGDKCYVVTKDQDRYTTIPQDFVFKQLAQNECLGAKKHRVQARRHGPDKVEPSLYQERTYTIPKDVSGQTSMPTFPEIFDLLPPTFNIKMPIESQVPTHGLSSGTVNVPHDHHIVLHNTFITNADTTTVLIGFHDDAINKQPFCLMCITSPGSIQKQGFYFSLIDLSIVEVLPGCPKSLLSSLKNQFSSPSKKLITISLMLKGFFHSSSLLHWYQSFRLEILNKTVMISQFQFRISTIP